MIITARFQYKTKLLVSSIQIYLNTNISAHLLYFDMMRYDRLTDRLTGLLLLSSILLFTSKYFR